MNRNNHSNAIDNYMILNSDIIKHISPAPIITGVSWRGQDGSWKLTGTPGLSQDNVVYNSLSANTTGNLVSVQW